MAPCYMLEWPYIGRHAQHWCKTSATMIHSCILINIRMHGMDGRDWDPMGCQWLAALVSRVCLYAIWMGGAGGGGGLGMGCQWLAGLYSL